MSLNIVQRDGSLQKVAGLSHNEFYYQSGTVNFNASANSWMTLDISFATPMPDSGYAVVLESGNAAYVHVQNVTYKGASGFTIIIWNRDSITDDRGIINWQAFRIPH